MSWEHGGGDGSSWTEAYLVPDADALDDVRDYQDTGVYFKQTANISLVNYQAGAGWVPFGTNTARFKGHFDGQKYWISALRINRTTEADQAIFGAIDTTGEVTRVRAYDAQITTTTGGACGIITGRNYGTLSSLWAGKLYGAKDVILNVGNNSGVLMGAHLGGTVTDSFARGSITRDAGGIGGITGNLGSGVSMARLAACCDVNIGTTATTTDGGGGIGNNLQPGSTVDSVSYCDLTAPNKNGIIGNFARYIDDNTTRCFAGGTNTVTDADYSNSAGFSTVAAVTLTDIYWADSINQTRNAGDPDTNPKDESISTAESKVAATFAGFNFETVWMMLTAAQIEAVHPGYGSAAYAALPANMQGRPWLRSLSDVLIEGITPILIKPNPLFFGGGW